jgi:hypothetical protein
MRHLHGSDEHASPLLFKIEDACREGNVPAPSRASTGHKDALHALQPHVVDVGVLLQLLPLERVPVSDRIPAQRGRNPISCALNAY